MEHSAYHRKHVLVPILLTCLGYACYNLYDAGAKDLLQKLHFSQVILTSGAIMLFFMAGYGWLKEGKKAFRTSKPGGMWVHAALYQIITIGSMIALPHVQLTTLYTLMFTSPFMVALLSGYFLKDKLDRQRLMVILFGFCVILFIFRPGGGLLSVWSLLLLFMAFLYSCRMVLVCRIGAGESQPYMFMACAVAGVLIGLAFLGDHYIPLTWQQWAIFIGMGFVDCIGLLFINYAFQTALSASVVAPYHYTQIIWGALLGYCMFSDVPDMRTVVGAALLILSGLYLLRHETRKAVVEAMA